MIKQCYKFLKIIKKKKQKTIFKSHDKKDSKF